MITKQSKKVWRRRILLLALVTAMWINIYLINPFGIAQNHFSMMFGYGIAQVLSGSMEPTFSEGAILLVKKTQKVKIGDIIVYQSGKDLIVHRIVDMQGNIIIAKGDANEKADQPFRNSDVRGRVVGWMTYTSQ